MASRSYSVALNALSATLILEAVDRTTYVELGYSVASEPWVILTGTPNDPVPVLLLFPSTPQIYLDGSGASTSSFPVPGSQLLAYNVVGGDSLYAIAGSSTPSVNVLVLRQ